MKITIYQPQYIHELGQRPNQEDSIYPAGGQASTVDRLFLVCDGMGGHEHGEVASQTLCQGMSEYLKIHSSHKTILQDQMLVDALEYACQQLDAKDDGNARKMGTTLTLLYFHRGGCTVAHIGDSRIYHLRPSSNTILYKSRDHSLVCDLYQAGEISYEDMKTSSQKNIITRAVMPGEDNRVKPDIVHITDIKSGDYFYLCSDGMLEKMEDNELLNTLSSADSDEKKRQQLILATTDNTDNHSAYIIHIKNVEIKETDNQLMNDEHTSRFNALNIHPVMESKDDVSIVTSPLKDDETSFNGNIAENVDKYHTSKRNRMLGIIAIVLGVVIALFMYGYFTNKVTETKKQNIDKQRLKSEDTKIDNQDSSGVLNKPITRETKHNVKVTGSVPNTEKAESEQKENEQKPAPKAQQERPEEKKSAKENLTQAAKDMNADDKDHSQKNRDDYSSKTEHKES